MRKSLFLALIILFVSSPSVASRVNPMNLETLYKTSDVIVLASVSKVVTLKYRDRVTIKVGAYLKSEAKEQSYTLTLTPRGLTGFDPVLKQGDVGVFFLKINPESGQVMTTHWGSIAMLPKPHFDSSPEN